ncbi:hypothetical protein [Enterobacter roggenkampii]|uniref:hypothetical protein n=1 Tax=Enterobacter roggenkampii TaxID=1812935 RepID=UPI001FD759B5|nr:hypothetical protein [Enterobacter roggenkampii]
MLDVFEREGMISRSGEKRKGSVITITNYAEYAQKWTIYLSVSPRISPRLMPSMAKPVLARLREDDAAHNGEHLPERFTENHEQQCNNNNKKH